MPAINIEDLSEKDKLKMEVEQLRKEVKLERQPVRQRPRGAPGQRGARSPAPPGSGARGRIGRSRAGRSGTARSCEGQGRWGPLCPRVALRDPRPPPRREAGTGLPPPPARRGRLRGEGEAPRDRHPPFPWPWVRHGTARHGPQQCGGRGRS